MIGKNGGQFLSSRTIPAAIRKDLVKGLVANIDYRYFNTQ